MDYSISQLLQEPVGATRKYTLNEDLATVDPELAIIEPLEGTLKLTRTQAGALLDLRGHTVVRVACGRCLDPVDVPVDLRITEEVLQTVDVTTGQPLRIEADDPSILIDDHHELHLADLVRQYIVTGLPIRPLCREGCRGLCPTCGQNLNDDPAHHHEEQIDERWATLKELLAKAE